MIVKNMTHCWCNHFIVLFGLVLKKNYFALRVERVSKLLTENDGTYNAQTMKFSIKYFFSQCCRKLRIWSHLLRKSLMENLIFCTVLIKSRSNSRAVLHRYITVYTDQKKSKVIGAAQFRITSR